MIFIDKLSAYHERRQKMKSDIRTQKRIRDDTLLRQMIMNRTYSSIDSEFSFFFDETFGYIKLLNLFYLTLKMF
jgi:hypothetical protein